MGAMSAADPAPLVAPPPDDPAVLEETRRALVRMGLIGRADRPALRRLTGGVSSDIWRVDLPAGPICIKRALAQLRVPQVWQAPVGRNAAEVAWIRKAAEVAPEAVPEILGHDPEAGLFAMRFLEPERYPVWKAELREGIARPATAAAVADRLVRIHRATAHDAAVAAAFANDATFHAIRLEPYLEATARLHTDLTDPLQALVAATQAAKCTLIHGDVSPKNILVGPAGPVFLDAECATYGDPAFDLAFCLNHLLLKCLWTPRARTDFLACFRALAAGYLAGVDWEAPAAFEARAARLLPGLFLARVDGKSPAEYLTEEAQKERVRRVARPLLAEPAAKLAEIEVRWARELET